MIEKKAELNAWVEEIASHHSPGWDNLPEIDLYMDQAIVLMEKYLGIFMGSENDKLISHSMINNYVKLGLISPPIRKKYSRKHLAYLMAICILKQVLPISNITDLLNNQTSHIEINDLFNLFGEEQDKALSVVAKFISGEIKDVAEEDMETYLNLLALKLTVTANANKLAAERIISMLKSKEKDKRKDASPAAPK